jgi:hypothetical protein
VVMVAAGVEDPEVVTAAADINQDIDESS